MTETQNTVDKKRADCLEWEDVKIDHKSRRAYCCLKEISVSPREYRILEFLIKSPGTVFSRDEIITSVWGKQTRIGSRTIDVYVRRLRKALNSDISCRFGIRSARSFGYSIDYVK